MIDPKIFADNSSIRAVWLFGSRARGDSDRFSDTDLVLIVEQMALPELVRLKHKLTAQVANESASLSIYTVPNVTAMARGGSLFLWHLKLEGRPLFSRSAWFEGVLRALEPYGTNRAKNDLITLRTVLTDVSASLRHADPVVEFEAATTFTVLRNVGNVTVAILDRPTFGRITPILVLGEHMGLRFPLSSSEIRRLMNAKLILSQKAPFNGPEWTTGELIQVVQKVCRVWDYAWEETCCRSPVS